MPPEGTATNSKAESLLSPDEPEAFEILNDQASAPILLVCDHASRRIPHSLGTMGLDPLVRRCHLALDIGAGDLTRQIAADLQITAVLCNYSRLVVDCNRQLMDPGAFLEFGDGIVISGNRNLHASDKKLRADEIYWPYHAAIDKQIARLTAISARPIIVSVHSFTPVLNGESRPWEIGVLWDVDRPTAEVFVADFRNAGFMVGDNEPYSGKAPQDFTLDHHAERNGLAHVGIEIRHDLIDSDAGVDRIAAEMSRIIDTLPARVLATESGPKQPIKSA